MSKEKELIKNTAIITFGRMCTQLISFVLLPLYTSILTTMEYGTVDLVLTYSTLLLPFITLALEQAVFRFLIDFRDDRETAGQYISTTFFSSLLLLLCVLVLIFAAFLFLKNSLLIYFGFALITSMISAISLQICRGLGDNIGYAFCSTVSAVTQIVCNVLFLAVFHLGAPGMMMAAFAGNSVCGIITYVRCDLSSYLKLKYFDRSVLKKLTSYSLPLIPNQLSWWALNASDKIIVQLMIGVAGNGLIAVANKFSGVYIQFSNIFSISWTESATLHIHDRDAETFFSKTINAVFRFFLCVCCGMIVCMPWVFPVLINHQYREAYGLIPVFMLASLFNVIVSLYGVIYVAYKKTVEIAKTAIYAAMLNIISHLILIKWIGLYAAAVSTVIGYGSMALYRYFHSRRYLRVQFDNATLIAGFVMLFLSFRSYYCGEMRVQLLSFTAILGLSIYLNKGIIFGIINEVKTKIHHFIKER